MGNGNITYRRRLVRFCSLDDIMLLLSALGQTEVYGFGRGPVLQYIYQLQLSRRMSVTGILIGVRMNNGYILLAMLMNEKRGACKVSQIQYKHQYIEYFRQSTHRQYCCSCMVITWLMNMQQLCFQLQRYNYY